MSLLYDTLVCQFIFYNFIICRARGKGAALPMAASFSGWIVGVSGRTNDVTSANDRGSIAIRLR
jgi:hypothetical protein